MAFLTIVKEAKHNDSRQLNPYQLMKRVWELINFITSPLAEQERETSRAKLKKRFDTFLPQGYSMLSPNYFWNNTAGKKPGGADFVESCARTYLAFNCEEP
jgi:hypothetical protein